ncbi:MAG: S-layer homology domain-containing protein [Oscillospiraceae bacterium]|nr:S-layer homology domain-containing protein [Oscillospiraceae bacterium]
MKRTKFLAALLAVLFVIGSISAGAEAYFNDFKPTTSNAQLYKNVVLLYELGILKGYEETDASGAAVLNIGLDRNVTRSEMAAFIFRLITTYVDKDLQGGTNATTFTDLTENEWYINYINWCVNKGIINGRDANSFDPDANVSYDEAIKMVVASLGYTGLVYPFGYNYQLRNLLDLEGMKLSDLLPNYKADTATVSYPATREDIVNMLAFAFIAPMNETYTTYENVGGVTVTKQVHKVLADDVWKEAGTAVTTNSYLVMATAGRTLEAATAWNGKDGDKVKDLKCELLNDKGERVATPTIVYFTFAELGISDKTSDYLGAKITATKVTKTDKYEKVTSYFVGPLTETLFAKEYKNVALSTETVTTGTDAEKGDWLTVTPSGVTGQRKKIADTNLFDVAARSNTVFDYTTAVANKTALFTALKAGAEYYATVLDIFADGKFDYVTVARKALGLRGDAIEATSSVGAKTTIKTLGANAVASIGTKANLVSLGASVDVLDTDIRNDCEAVKGDFFVYYVLANKYILEKTVEYQDGIVTKAVQSSGKYTWTIALDKLAQDGSTVKIDVTLPTSNAPLANGVTISNEGAFIQPATEASFIIYAGKLYAVTAEGTPAPTTRTTLGVFYGMYSRTVKSMTPTYVADGLGYKLVYTVVYDYNALMALDNKDGTGYIQKVKFNAYGTADFNKYFGEIAPTDLKVGYEQLALEQTVVDLTAPIDSRLPGYTIAVPAAGEVPAQYAFTNSTPVEYTVDANSVYTMYAAVTAEAAESVVKVSGVDYTSLYIVFNPSTGYYELYKSKAGYAAPVLLNTFKCDSETRIITSDVLTRNSYIAKNFGEATYHPVKTNFDYVPYDEFKVDVLSLDNVAAGIPTVIFKAVTDPITSRTVLTLREVYVNKAVEANYDAPIGDVDLEDIAYNTTVLKSIDSTSVEGKTATVAYTLLNPYNKASKQVVKSFEGTDIADAMNKLNAYITDTLEDMLGRPVFDDDGTLELDYDSFSFYYATAGGTTEGNVIYGKASVVFTASDSYIVEIDNFPGKYFKIKNDCNIFNWNLDAAGNGVLQYIDYGTAITVRKTDKTYNLDNQELMFVLDGENNIAFAATVKLGYDLTDLANYTDVSNTIGADVDVTYTKSFLKWYDNMCIAAAKANIEAASYTSAQANAATAAAALTKAQALVDALTLNGTTATAVAGTFTAATAGTEGTPAGVNGSYTFTVEIAKGTGTTATSAVKTMTITATPNPAD